MEFARKADGPIEKFGIYMYDAHGAKLCALESTDHCNLAMTEPANYRQGVSALAHDLMSNNKIVQSMSDTERAEWQRDWARQTAQLGDATVILNASQIRFMDESPGGLVTNFYGLDGLVTNSVVVGRDDSAIVGKMHGSGERGRIVVIDGGVDIRSSADSRSATLGSLTLHGEKSGTSIKLPVSSLTLFGQDGTLLYRVPE